MNDGLYELFDSTDDENYITLGTWTTRQAALDAIAECKKPSDFCSPHEPVDEVFCVELCRREFGWMNRGKVIATWTWTEIFDDDDKGTWMITGGCVLPEDQR